MNVSRVVSHLGVAQSRNHAAIKEGIAHRT